MPKNKTVIKENKNNKYLIISSEKATPQYQSNIDKTTSFGELTNFEIIKRISAALRIQETDVSFNFHIQAGFHDSAIDAGFGLTHIFAREEERLEELYKIYMSNPYNAKTKIQALIYFFVDIFKWLSK